MFTHLHMLTLSLFYTFSPSHQMASQEELTSIFQGIRQSADPTNNSFFSAHDQTSVLNMFRVFIYVMEICGHDHSINPCFEEDIKVNLFYFKLRILFKYFYSEADNPQCDCHRLSMACGEKPMQCQGSLKWNRESRQRTFMAPMHQWRSHYLAFSRTSRVKMALSLSLLREWQGSLKRGVEALIENKQKLV